MRSAAEPKRVVDRLLQKVPFFLRRSPVSLTRAHTKAIARELQAAETTTNLLKTVFALRRPIRLWKAQARPKKYAIAFDIAIRDLKRVKLYEDDKKIYDSGKLKFNVNHLKKTFYLTSTTIIPRSTYLLEIEDHWGNVYEKGVPENLEFKGNAFDPDLLLDLKGKLIGCPRYRFKPVVVDQLPYTYPSFHDQPLEPDFYYERRLRRYLEILNARGIIHAALYRYLGVEPVVIGHWRRLCEQNVSYQSQKYMSTKNANSALFYVSVREDAVPHNLGRDVRELEKITEALSPSKKFIYEAISRYETIEDTFSIDHRTALDALSTRPDILRAADLREGAFRGSLAERLGALDVAGPLSPRTSERAKISDGAGGLLPLDVFQDSIRVDDIASCALSRMLQPDCSRIRDSLRGQLVSRHCDPFNAIDAIEPSLVGLVLDSMRVSEDLGLANSITDAFGIGSLVRGSLVSVYLDAAKVAEAIAIAQIVRDSIRTVDAGILKASGAATDVSKALDAISGMSEGFTEDGIEPLDTAAIFLEKKLADLLETFDTATMVSKAILADDLSPLDTATGTFQTTSADVFKSEDAASAALAKVLSDPLGAGDATISAFLGTFADISQLTDIATMAPRAAIADAFESADVTDTMRLETSPDALTSEDATLLTSQGKSDDAMNASESGSCTRYDRVKKFETDEEFETMDLTGGVIIEGTGPEAVLTVTEGERETKELGPAWAQSARTEKYTDCPEGGTWWYPERIKECDGQSVYAGLKHECRSDKLIIKGFFGSLPSGEVRGIEFILRRNAFGSFVDELLQIRLDEKESEDKADKTSRWPDSWRVDTYGGRDDLWGLSNVRLSELNKLEVCLAVRRLGAGLYHYAMIDCAAVKIYYQEASEGSASYELTAQDIDQNLGVVKAECDITGGSIAMEIIEGASSLRTVELQDGTNIIDLRDLEVADDATYQIKFTLKSEESSKPKVHSIEHFKSVEIKF